MGQVEVKEDQSKTLSSWCERSIMLKNSQQVCLLSEHTHTKSSYSMSQHRVWWFYEHTSITEELMTMDDFWRRK